MAAIPSIRDLVDRASDDELLNSASAISFQVLTAIVPLVLFTLALAGFLNLKDVWFDASVELRPKIRTEAFILIDDTVQRIIDEKQWFWLTGGLALMLWRQSTAMRAVMTALDRIYHVERDRSLRERVVVSLLLSAAVTVLLLCAVALVRLGPAVLDADGVLGVLLAILRWVVATALLLFAVGLTLHHAPGEKQPLKWVSLGSLLSVGCWLVASIAFAFYATEIASYGSLFGAFATIFVALTYLYLSVAAFLVGVLIDADVRDNN